ncbi:hypothetical protein ACIA49_22630 [Kribbella sp. NPDC051587]|uniref:hypothetical protein n=1 Tax=Kribbella sp. NPDC051587 TaxID=3364119 RepID=UPI0037B866EB
MELLACGHLANEGPFRTCLHLCVEEASQVSRLYTGRGGDYHLLCGACAKLDDLWSQLAAVCEGCTDRADARSVDHVSGQPEVRRLDRPLDGCFSEDAAPVRPRNDRCLAPMADGWLAYTGHHLVPSGGTSYKLELPGDEDDDSFGTPGPALHVSEDGRYAAVVRDFGRYGVVVDLADGRVTLRLDRQDYCNFATPFPIAFLPDGTLVAATDWNRLDRFNPATGELLTPRDTELRDKENPPPDYLDYFHGALTVSPTGRWLLDDGWIWHPVGVPAVVDLAAWQDGRTFAAEHGNELVVRDYLWNQPASWVNDSVVAIQGVGDGIDALVDGVQLYDARSGARVGTVFGPKGRMWGVDGRLAVVGEDGLEFWDPAEGARVGVLAGYRPTAYNPRTRTFAALDNQVLRTYRLT